MLSGQFANKTTTLSKEHVPVGFMIGDCVVACGNCDVAGLLLYRLAYLHLKTKFFRDGKFYYIRNRADIMRDTGLTRHKYDRAIRVLRNLGFVETSNAARVGSTQPMQTTAFSVTDIAFSAIRLSMLDR